MINEQEPVFREISIRDIYTVIFRHKKKIIFITLAAVLATAFIIYTTAPVYRSETSLFISIGRESLNIIPTASSDRVIAPPASRIQEIRTEIEILRNRSISESLVDEFGFEFFLEDKPLPQTFIDSLAVRERLVNNLVESFVVEPVRDSPVIRVAYSSGNPGRTHTVLSRFLDIYMEKHMEIRYTNNFVDFFRERTEISKKNLETIENGLRDLKNFTQINSVPEHRAMLLNRIGLLLGEADANQAALAESREKINTISQTLQSATGPRTVTTAIYDNLRNELIIQETNFAAFEARNSELIKSIEEVRKEISHLTDSEYRIAELEREREIHSNNYLRYSSSLEEARIDKIVSEERLSNIKVIQTPTFPIDPLPARRSKKMVLGLFVGATMALVMAFMSEYMDHSVRDESTIVEKLNLNTIAVIPDYSRKEISERKKENRIVRTENKLLSSPHQKHSGYPNEVGAHNGSGTEILIPAIISHSGLQVFETLRKGLTVSDEPSNREIRLITVTSCRGGEGVSTVAANLAISLSNITDEDILVVNTNINNAGKTEKNTGSADNTNKFIKENKSGMFGHMAGKPNLFTLTAGEILHEFTTRHETPFLNDLIGQWKQRFRYIIFDSPPVLSNKRRWYDINSTFHLANLSDGVILVVKSENVRWEVVGWVKERMLNSGARILGVVLNRKKHYIPNWLYKTL